MVKCLVFYIVFLIVSPCSLLAAEEDANEQLNALIREIVHKVGIGAKPNPLSEQEKKDLSERALSLFRRGAKTEYHTYFGYLGNLQLVKFCFTTFDSRCAYPATYFSFLNAIEAGDQAMVSLFIASGFDVLQKKIYEVFRSDFAKKALERAYNDLSRFLNDTILAAENGDEDLSKCLVQYAVESKNDELFSLMHELILTKRETRRVIIERCWVALLVIRKLANADVVFAILAMI